MTFGPYLFGVTLALPALRLLLFELFERDGDRPPFRRFMAETRHPRKGWIRALMVALVLAAGAWGWATYG
jgi:hypothetical protein